MFSKQNKVISEATIIEFQKALKEEYLRDVSFSEASQMLNDLVAYFDLLIKIEGRDPAPVSDILNYNKTQ